MADGYSEQVCQLWNDAYNLCQHLYDDDKLEDCIDAIESDLLGSSMPLYHRMRYYLLLAESLGDWHEAEDALLRCEYLLQSTSTHHRQDPDENVQGSLRQIRRLLVGARAHDATQPRPGRDSRFPGEDDMDVMEADVEVMDGYEEDDEDDEDKDEEEDEDEDEAIMETEELLEVDDSVKGVPSEIVEFNSSVKRTPGEVEDVKSVVEPSSKAAEVKSGVTTDPARLPELSFDRPGAVSRLVSMNETANNTDSAADRKLRADDKTNIDNKIADSNKSARSEANDIESGENKIAVKTEPELEATQRLSKSSTLAIRIPKREPKTE